MKETWKAAIVFAVGLSSTIAFASLIKQYPRASWLFVPMGFCFGWLYSRAHNWSLLIDRKREEREANGKP